MPYHSRVTGKLRSGRISDAGSFYFLTWCTHHRARILTDPSVLPVACTAISTIDSSRDAIILAATIMPDHVHVLLQLGSRLSISQLVARTKATISRNQPIVKWQLNFFEHRLRDTKAAEDFAFYMFMNPYVANLCALSERWAGWLPSRAIRWSFEDKLCDDQVPPAAWLAKASHFAQILPAGAD